MSTTFHAALALSLTFGAVGCDARVLDVTTGPSRGEPCIPGTEPACRDDLGCEPLADPEGEFLCAPRVEIRGQVIDALRESPIADAQVVAADEIGAPVSMVARTDAQGRYVLPMTLPRDADGEPALLPTWTLIVSARGYLPFPAPLRPALPIEGDDLAPDDDPAVLGVLEGPTTTVALIPSTRTGGVTISGRVEAEAAAGTLVVAESSPPAPIAVADIDGSFTLFNVPAGVVEVRGFKQGVELAPVSLQVGTADIDDLRLVAITEDPAALAVVRGDLRIVDAPGGLRSSVVLVPTVAYLDGLEAGPVPVGLRAPSPPQAPDVQTAFEIAGVPAGRYTVLAAVENDGLVRDPDQTIAGTQIQQIEVEAGQAVELADSIKVTEALAVVSPGADDIELTSAAPLLTWIDDSGEDRYSVVVRDARGDEVWRDDEVPRVTGQTEASVPYAGPPLQAGMVYQFRVTAWRNAAQAGEEDTPITRSEDRRGVFVVQ